MKVAYIILGLVTLQRLAELVHAWRNTRRLLAEGGVEVGAGHYPVIVLLHAAWLASLWLFVSAETPISGLFLYLYVVLQVGRVWTLASLGRFWTTRIITVPGAPLVRRGPYRITRHPNYVIVAAEVAVLPLVFGLWEIAVTFSVLNAVMLQHRIRVEERALDLRSR